MKQITNDWLNLFNLKLINWFRVLYKTWPSRQIRFHNRHKMVLWGDCGQTGNGILYLIIVSAAYQDNQLIISWTG